MKRNFCRVMIFIIFLIFSFYNVQLVFAGTTGKIAGRIIDKETGEPLIAINVVIEGTFLGAATDIDGFYTILHVPPGTYTVKALAIGYSDMVANDVRVRIDQTSRVDFELTSEAVTGDTVVIIAERNIIREDVSTSVVAFQGNEIEELAVSNVSDVVELQAGVEDGLEIRGSQANEVLFQIDGVTLRDPRNNEPISRVALSAVKEISIERGGFNAEYGHVRSGIINVVTKEGSRTGYEGTITVKGSPPAAKHFGISPYDRNSMWMRPYLDPEVCWTGTKGEPFTDENDNTFYDEGEVYEDVNGDNKWTGWDRYAQQQYPEFIGWNEVSRQLCSDSDPTNDLTPVGAQRLWEWEHRQRPKTDQWDYNIDAGFGGPVPFIGKKLGNLRFFTSYRQEREMLLIPLSRDDYLDYDLTLRLTSDIDPSTKLQVSGFMGKSYNVAINANDRQYNNPSWGINGVTYWLPTDYMRSPYSIAEMTKEERDCRLFTNSWYSQADVSYKSLAAKLTRSLSTNTFFEASIEHFNQKYQTGPVRDRDLTKRYQIVPGYYVDEAPFGFNIAPEAGIAGTNLFFGGHSSTSRDSSNGSSTTLKFDLTSQVNFSNLIKTGFEFIYNDLYFDYGEVNEFFGTVSYVKESQFPIRAAAYVQDKIEALGFIANLGLRLDYSNSNTEWVILTDPFDPTYLSPQYKPGEKYNAKEAEAEITLSPRLGISHPITKNSKIFFNYGHFKQMPTYEEIFRIERELTGGMKYYGDPNLVLAKTVSYELGYDHVLFNDYLIQLAGYYHDIADQQGLTTYYDARGIVSYSRANNNSYEDIRGFELTLRKTGGRWWTGFANYTYHVSTSGIFGRTSVFQSISEQRIYDETTTNFYQQKPKPQPFARAILTFFTPEEYGPKAAGLRPLGDWKLNFIADWRAGEWITHNPNDAKNVLNNLQVTDDYNVDIRLVKRFGFDKFNINLFLEIRNAFNFKKLSGAGFYNFTDSEAYFNSLHLPESRGYNNIPGDDRPGNYRKTGVPYQPMELRGSIRYENEYDDEGVIIPGMTMDTGEEGVIYYDKSTDKYVEYFAGDETVGVDPYWNNIEKSRLNKILDDKAYIDMPNQSSFNFLNPRQVFFGITTTFSLD
jgi:outer membrane receptor protein involved in Fe transport